jgi:RNA polymerase sigma-70 factor, ECF subfamily
MTDADLVAQFRQGNGEAFSELVRRYSRPITIMILRMVRDPEDAKDLSQEVFLKAYEGIPRFMSASSFKTWLYTIALNTARDHIRKHRPTVSPDELNALESPAEPAELQLDRARFSERLRAEIERLPEKQRLTLQLRVHEELDYREIARVLGGTAGGARGNFFQAVKTLKERLGANP